MFAQYKNKLYNEWVNAYPEVKAHYEGYKESNPDYHEQHHMQSLKFLRQLNKYYKNGKVGSFPTPPRDYTVKGSDIFVPADRQEPTKSISAENIHASFNNPTDIVVSAPKPAAPASKPAAPAPKPATSAPKPAAPASKPATPVPQPVASAPKPAATISKPSQPVRENSTFLVPAQVRPYLDGPESSKRKCLDAYHFALTLMKYSVISFDIFDTLVFRKLNQPADVFMLVGEKLGVFNFYGIRKKSEEEVRQYKKTMCKNSEVTLEEIYERVTYYTGIDPHEGAAIEYETELNMCFANPYMLRVFEILKASGKRIYATSNMYFTKEKMEKLLSRCGYDGFEGILVSCDYHTGKGNGDLFKILLNKAGTNDIIHVGDNVGADIKGAEKAGVVAKYYQSCRDLGDMHRSRGISWLIESAYRGIVNTTLHNGTKTFSPLWEYGFIYGGLAALGYVSWIHRRAKAEGISKILFLSRDGFLLKKVYDMLFQDIPSEYIFWSRIAAFRNISTGERYPFLERVVMEQCGKNVSIGEMLEWIGLSGLNDLFQTENVLPTSIISDSNVVLICDLLVNNWDMVEKTLQKAKNETGNYLLHTIEGYDSVAIVDLGWSAKSLSPLKNRILQVRGKNSNARVKLYMMGSLTTTENSSQMLSGDIECYMFHPSLNREIRDRMRKETPLSLEMIEKMFNAPQCSFLGHTAGGEMEFAPPEIDNYKGFLEIENGILDFCSKYYKAFEEYPYLLNIDGYDAFIPMRLLLNNKNAVFSLIGKLSYNNGIVPTNRENLLEAFGGKK